MSWITGIIPVIMKTKLSSTLPLPVLRALRTLGEDIRRARIRRRLPTALVAERAFMTRTTLGKIERGDPGVAMGNYATVLYILGMVDRLVEIASAASDTVGQLAEDYGGPKRIRMPKRAPT